MLQYLRAGPCVPREIRFGWAPYKAREQPLGSDTDWVGFYMLFFTYDRLTGQALPGIRLRFRVDVFDSTSTLVGSDEYVTEPTERITGLPYAYTFMCPAGWYPYNTLCQVWALELIYPSPCYFYTLPLPSTTNVVNIPKDTSASYCPAPGEPGHGTPPDPPGA